MAPVPRSSPSPLQQLLPCRSPRHYTAETLLFSVIAIKLQANAPRLIVAFWKGAQFIVQTSTAMSSKFKVADESLSERRAFCANQVFALGFHTCDDCSRCDLGCAWSETRTPRSQHGMRYQHKLKITFQLLNVVTSGYGLL